MKHFKKICMSVYIIICFFITACSSSANDPEPNEKEMEIAIHARVIDFQNDSMEVHIEEDGVDQDTVYKVNLKDCEFYMNPDDISEGYPILIIPADSFIEEDTSLKAI